MSKNNPTRQPAKPNSPQALPNPAQVLKTEQRVEMSSGPIPSPEVLEKYNRAIPGLADRIVLAFESEYSHRHEMEAMALQADIQAMQLEHGNRSRGQYLGFGLCLLVVAWAGYLVLEGHEWAGSTIGATALGSVVASSLIGNHTRVSESQQKGMANTTSTETKP